MDHKASASVQVNSDGSNKANGEVNIRDNSQLILIIILVLSLIGTAFNVYRIVEERDQNERIERLENGH